MKKIMSLFLSAAMVLGLSGCGSMNNTTKMGLGGAGGGAAIGAIIGGLIGHGKGAAIGAAVGAAGRHLLRRCYRLWRSVCFR